MTRDCHAGICGSRGLRCPRPPGGPSAHGPRWTGALATLATADPEAFCVTDRTPTTGLGSTRRMLPPVAFFTVESSRLPWGDAVRILGADSWPGMPLASAREKAEIIMNANPAANIVLVHGGFVDGSGWRPVYDLLTKDGYRVAVVQNPTLSLQGDAAATRLIADAQGGPVVLVGHSYGGAVISEAGTDPNVAALVYIAAFAPDKDESVNSLIGGFPQDGPQPPILPPKDGFLFLDRDKFHESFAGDLPADLAAFMADSQVPWGLDAIGEPVTDPGWRAKPSWYLVTTEDRMIPPPAQRTMAQRAGSTVAEVAASHSVYVSQPAGWLSSSSRPCPPSPRSSNCGTRLYCTDKPPQPRPRCSFAQPQSGSQARPIPRDREGRRLRNQGSRTSVTAVRGDAESAHCDPSC